MTDERRGVVDSVITALADPTRRQLLDLLATQGEATATKLAERLPVSRQAVVKHLDDAVALGDECLDAEQPVELSGWEFRAPLALHARWD